MKTRQKIILLFSLVVLLSTGSCAFRVDSTKNNSDLDKRALNRRQKTFLTHRKHRGPKKIVVWFQRKQMLRKKDKASKK